MLLRDREKHNFPLSLPCYYSTYSMNNNSNNKQQSQGVDSAGTHLNRFLLTFDFSGSRKV
uniref:Uncharacterized protein n=1 Tax=Anguilla anguilla TaxID=7936 RepID=A0A0E9Q551_ANGAN